MDLMKLTSIEVEGLRDKKEREREREREIGWDTFHKLTPSNTSFSCVQIFQIYTIDRNGTSL